MKTRIKNLFFFGKNRLKGLGKIVNVLNQDKVLIIFPRVLYNR